MWPAASQRGAAPAASCGEPLRAASGETAFEFPLLRRLGYDDATVAQYHDEGVI